MGVTLDVNSLNDHRHMRGSLHFDDRAVDLDTVGDVWSDLVRLDTFLRHYLRDPYEVIFEGDHVHIEVNE